MAITLVQYNAFENVTSSPDTTLVTSLLPSAPTVGNHVIVMSFVNTSGSALTISASDAWGNSYTTATLSPTIGSLTHSYLSVSYSKITTSNSSFQSSVNLSGGSGNISNAIAEFSGIDDIDGSGVSASGTSANPAPGNLTVVSGSLVIAMFGTDYSTFFSTINSPSGWTKIADNGGSPPTVGDNIYKINPSSPSNPTWTNAVDSGTTIDWGAAQFAFKPPSPFGIDPLFMMLL